MNQKKIVITGGPSTGKTSVIQKLEENGFLCFHEVIRDMTLEEKKRNGKESFVVNPIVSVPNPLAFNRKLLKGRIGQYETANEMERSPVFFDRGIPDIIAYMDCFGQFYDETFENACRILRYDLVLLMPPWPEIHRKDNARFENYEDSLRIHDCLKKAYIAFGYNPLMVPKSSVPERMEYILNLVNVL